MNISEIKQDEKVFSIFHVTFKPNRIERFFGCTEKTVRYRTTGSTYICGGGRVYMKEDGTRLDNGDWVAKAIDRFRDKF